MKRAALLLCLALAPCNRGATTSADNDTPGDDPNWILAGGEGDETPVPAMEPASASWEIKPSENGTVVVSREGVPVAGMKYLFFAEDFKWAGPKVTDGKAKGGKRPFAITVKELPVSGSGSITTGEGEVTLEYQLTVEKPLSNISGLGIEFRFDLEPAVWGDSAPKSQLLDDNGGVVVGKPDDGIALTVSGDRAKVYYERKQPKAVRVMFVAGDVNKGAYATKIKIKLPEGGGIAQSDADRYGPAGNNWHKNALVWDDWPVDVSFLNDGDRPAGTHGAVRVDGDGLVFADGTAARFWGTNIVAATLYKGDKAAVAKQAKRIAAMGYNLVRIHHHDAPWTKTNVFDTSGGTTQRLDDDAIDRLDWWIKCLEDEGIYVWIDLHVSRRFMRGDAIDGFEEVERTAEGIGKAFNYVNPRLEKLMQRFAEQYLGRRNRYTGRVWATDPALVGVLITNENDLTDHGGAAFLPKHGNTVHTAFAKQLGQEITDKTGLPFDKVMRLWEPGPAKIVLNEIQHRFDARAIAHLRTLGVSAPIATTNYWGKNKIYSLPALAAGGIVDVHSYGKAEALSANPHRQSTWLHFIAAAQVLGKPIAVSEWNVPPPARDRFTAPLWIASVGALQGWDAPMHFSYNHGPNEAPRRLQKHTAWVDPALMATMPAAAVLFRRGDVKGADKTVVLSPTREAAYYERHNATQSVSFRTLAERSKMVLRLPDIDEFDWDAPAPLPAGAEVVDDLGHDFLDAGATSITSDTGELERDFAAGIHTIDTPRSQVASGWIGGKTIQLKDARFEISTAKAVVALTSLDGLPLRKSQRILVTAVARANANARSTGFDSEPVQGRVGVRSRHDLGIVALSARSRASKPPPGRKPSAGKKVGDTRVFDLPKLATHWYLLVPR